MPIIANLANRTTIGMGASPMINYATDTALSISHAVKYKYCNAAITVSGANRLTCTRATSININGTYLFFEDNWTTVCRMDALRPIVVSGSFSGCLFKIFRGGGAFYAAHIARPNITPDANVVLIDDYADQKGWTEVQQVPSSGVIANYDAANTVIMVSEYNGNSIDTVRLAVNNLGATVNAHRVTTNV